MLYATAQTLAHGRRAGWMAALGLHVGGYVHIFAAAFGLAYLLETWPGLYLFLRYAGAGYLVWLGAQMMMQIHSGTASPSSAEPSQGPETFIQSMLVEILNPKSVIFYVAFLPPFTDPAAAFSLSVQLLLLGTIVNIMFSSADMLCVVIAGKLMTTFKGAGPSNRWLPLCGGLLLIALGLYVALIH